MGEADSNTDDRFMQLLTQNQRRLLAFIAGMTPSLGDAEDVLQEINMALWKKRELYDWDQGFLQWAFGFAWIEIRRFRDRHSAKHLWASDAVLESLAAAYPRETGVREQRLDALAGCIDKLRTDERLLINDFYARQQSAKALAESTGRSVRNVYKLLTKTRQRLRECVERSLAQRSRPV